MAVLLILAAPQQEAVEVSILRLSAWPELHTHTIPDPITLGDSDDESAGVESETDYGDFDADVTAKSDSSSPHIVDSDMADDNSVGSTYNSDRLVADHQNHDNDSDVVDGEKLQLAADFPTSPGHRSVTYIPSQPHAGE